jgi:inhibitor of cysteine peptidase
MKRLIAASLAVIVLLAAILSGCSSGVQAYTESGQVVNTEVNQEITIALGSNLTTGYGWQEAYDNAALNLIKKDYKTDDKTGKQLVGSGGTEFFVFKALKKGETKINFTYRRPWETPSPQDQQQVFTINIK